MIKRITEAFHLPHLSLLTSSYKLKPIHWFRHMFCRLHVAYILYYKHYQLKYLRVSPIDTRPIYFRFNKTESILVIYLIRELLPLVGNETDSSVVWRFCSVFESVIGWGLEAIAAYVYTHIMKAATYSVCMYFVYISAYHIHILPNICCIH